MAAPTARQRASRAPSAPKPMTASQRKTIATKAVAHAITASDQGLALTAALEAVSERLAGDADLRQSIQQKYEELHALSVAAGAAKPKKEDFGPMPPLIRVAGVNRHSPLYMLDPYELALDYGRDQLRNVVRRASIANLRVAVGVVKERNPGKKPTGTSKQGMIDFIVEHVAGPGY